MRGLILDVGGTYWGAFDQSRGHIATFIRFCGSLVGEDTRMDVLNILHNRVGGDDARMDSCSTGKGYGREEERSEIGELHVGCVKEGRYVGL
jgi:hypothetical protein